MNFDDYLTEYYGFNTQNNMWKRMGGQAKHLLRESFKMDMAKEQEKIKIAEADSLKDDTKVAKLYPNNKE